MDIVDSKIIFNWVIDDVQSIGLMDNNTILYYFKGDSIVFIGLDAKSILIKCFNRINTLHLTMQLDVVVNTKLLMFSKSKHSP